MELQTPDAKRQTSRRWIWFFALLSILAVAGISLEIWFNLRQQLTPAKLADARRLWAERGPATYTLQYAVKTDYRPESEGGQWTKYTVEVRDGKAIAVTRADGKPVASGELPFATLDDLFAFIASRLEEDAQPGRPRPFVTATFDRENGRVIHYVRSVTRTLERIEVSVKMEPASAVR